MVLVGRRWVKARRANSPEEGLGGVKPLAENSVYTVAEGNNANDKKKNRKEPGDNFMNQTELNKYRAVLEARQTELSAGLRNREDIAIERPQTPSTKCQSPGSASSQSATWTGNRTCSATSAARCCAWPMAATASACIAKRISSPSAWKRCPGPSSASPARKRRIATNSNRPRWTNCWQTRLKFYPTGGARGISRPSYF